MGTWRGARGVKVPPLSREVIRRRASLVRQRMNLDDLEAVDLVSVVEHRLSDMGLVLDVQDGLPEGEEARTLPDDNLIILGESVYDGMVRGEPRARFTVAHELGHLFLHRGVAPVFTRGPWGHMPYEDSEWQADCFAAEFLMPLRGVAATCSTVEDIVRRYRVSRTAAKIRLDNLREEGVVRNLRIAEPSHGR